MVLLQLSLISRKTMGRSGGRQASKSQALGAPGGSVHRAHTSWSWGNEFEACGGQETNLKKKEEEEDNNNNN